MSATPATGIQGLDVDRSTDNLYLDRGNRIDTYSPGTAGEHSYQSAPSFGIGDLTASHVIAVSKDHRVFASTESGEGPQDRRLWARLAPSRRSYRTRRELDEIGHEEVEVHGHVDLDGTPEVESCVFEYGTSTGYGSGTPCSPASFSSDEDVEAELSGLTTGTTYHYRVRSHDSEWGQYRHRSHRHAEPRPSSPHPRCNRSGHRRRSAQRLVRFLRPAHRLLLQIRPHRLLRVRNGAGRSRRRGRQRNCGRSGRCAAERPNLPLQGHREKRQRHDDGSGYDLQDGLGTLDANGVRSTEVEPTSAIVHASINPVGYAAKYFFEYGQTPSYSVKDACRAGGYRLRQGQRGRPAAADCIAAGLHVSLPGSRRKRMGNVIESSIRPSTTCPLPAPTTS